jgi:hypothetical protein
MNRPGTRTAVAVLALLVTLAIAAAPAAAKIIHHKEGSFNGADTPGGQFGAILPSDAVDQSNGDVYVTESNFFGLGRGVVDKFDENGAYAGVEINGTTTPQGSFAFNLGSGTAVDSSAHANQGDLYVADTEHGVVDRFSESGTFECQITGKTPASLEEEEDECNGAAGSHTPDGSIAPAGLAVDQSGDLYVADHAHAVIDKFGPSGEYLSQIADSHLTNEMQTIALDSAGNLYVVTANAAFGENAQVVKFDQAGSFVSVIDPNPSFGVGVDPATDHVYVSDSKEFQAEIAEYDPSGALLDTFQTSVFGGLGVNGTTGQLYAPELLDFGGASVQIYSGDIVVPTVTTSPATNVEETSATLNGHVDLDTAHGGGEVTSCKFEYGPTKAYGETAPCTPGPPYASAQDVSANVTELTRSTTYHFRLVAANANGTGEGEDETFSTPGPPSIDSESSHLNGRDATLKAQINPFGFDTTCQVQYVDEASFQSSKYANATTLPCTPEDLGSGFGDVEASATVEGLKVATTYHYRFLATNQAGLSGAADRTFSTFGVEAFSFEVLDEEGHPYTQAGGHPYQWTTTIKLNTTPAANLKDVVTELPPGLIGNPTATPACSRYDMSISRCSGDAQVGTIRVNDTSGENFEAGLYHVVPTTAAPAEFGAVIANYARVFIAANVRTGGDYGVTAESLNASAQAGITEVSVALWGVPAAASHDAERGCATPDPNGNYESPCSANQPQPKPFLTNPTSCGGPLAVSLHVDSWQAPGEFVDAATEMPPITGCNALEFEPTLEARPTTNVADSPSGLNVDLHIPQNEDPNGKAEANLRDTKVILPPGLLVNPAAAAGLEACSGAQIGLTSAPGQTPVRFTGAPPSCPDAAKIGTVEVDTPLLDHPLPGAVYLAKPYDNPFDSLLAIYIAVDDPESGVVVKLAGHVEPDPSTGRLTTTFDENPQLPFEDFKLDFFKGPHATLRTPPTCDADPSTPQLDPYTTTSVLTPWSAPESGLPPTPSDSYQISAAPGGGNCPASSSQEPHSPAFEAGTEAPRAGAYSPFALHLARADDSQELKGINTVLPPGLTGKLAGVAECPEAAIEAAKGKAGAQEQASPSCPPGSQVGLVNVGVGAGPSPYYVQGKAYLAGPYKGGPLSLAIITPAVAGPFDLGNVVVRAALYVSPETAQITAKSDPIPSILQGIPLDVRSIALNMTRNQFTLNPTSCEKMAVGGEALSVLDQSASLTDPFQVGGCSVLPFHPKLKLNLKGGTKRSKHPALRAVLTAKPGEANIARAQVSLPHSEFLDQGHIKTICTRVIFAEGAVPGERCPAGSVYGHATAITPLLDKPLEGPVYLRSSSHELPDLVAALNGQIQVVLDGRIDSVKGGIRNSFEAVPDAPVSKFVLEMQGGSKGLLVNSTNICKSTNRATVNMTGQNGKLHDTEPVVTNSCKGKGNKHKRRGHRTAR